MKCVCVCVSTKTRTKRKRAMKTLLGSLLHLKNISTTSKLQKIDQERSFAPLNIFCNSPFDNVCVVRMYNGFCMCASGFRVPIHLQNIETVQQPNRCMQHYFFQHRCSSSISIRMSKGTIYTHSNRHFAQVPRQFAPMCECMYAIAQLEPFMANRNSSTHTSSCNIITSRLLYYAYGECFENMKTILFFFSFC